VIEFNLEVYIYALYTLMITSISAFLLVIKSLSNTELSEIPLKLYSLYFTFGVIGWLALAAKDTSSISIELTSLIVFYIFCSYLLLLAVARLSKINKHTIIITTVHVVFIISNLFLGGDNERVLFVSLYSLIVYPFILYLSAKQGFLNKNVGDWIISFAAFLVIAAIPVQIYTVIVTHDISFAYYAIFITSSTGFILVGIGLFSSILINEHNQLTLLTLKDPLTGLFNRRGMDFSIRVSLSEALRSNKPICAIVMDIDNFKSINDNYGHSGGDLVLKEVSQLLLNSTRPSDVCCRIGGEEFVIIMIDSNETDIIRVADRIRYQIEKVEILHENKVIRFTSSFGVASQQNEVDVDSLLDNADKALYMSKSNGKNRVTVFKAKK